MTSSADLALLSPDALRQLAARLLVEMRSKQALIDKLTHENVTLKRLKFAASSEAYTGEQQRLLFETLDTDLEAVSAEIEQLAPSTQADDGRRQPKRTPLPANLPRREIVHEPQSTTCRCGCLLQRIGEDIAEKLDYQPGVFTVERHVRGKWVCKQCETLVQTPVAPQIIDQGIPTAGLLAHVLVAKYANHLPLYRHPASSPEPVWRSRTPHWRNGRASAACSYSHWSTRCAKSCSLNQCCMLTRRRWRCSSLATARRIAPTCGAIAAPASAP